MVAFVLLQTGHNPVYCVCTVLTRLVLLWLALRNWPVSCLNKWEALGCDPVRLTGLYRKPSINKVCDMCSLLPYGTGYAVREIYFCFFTSWWQTRREAGLFWCLPPSGISGLSSASLLFLPSTVAHCVFSLFLLLAYFPEIFFNIGWEMISWSAVSVVCYLMALVLAIYAFRHVSFFISWFVWWFCTCFCKLVLIN